jgi:rare lipoprotein A
MCVRRIQGFSLSIGVLISGVGAAFLPVFQHDAHAEKACAAKAPNAAQKTAKVQKGEASWYGNANKGKKTASGEKFDPNASTAAHPSLPLGTEIEVTNLENGKETTLTVNDRGPKTKGRVLDVSKKGAQDLGFTKDGTAQVKIEPKNEPKAAPKQNQC